MEVPPPVFLVSSVVQITEYLCELLEIMPNPSVYPFTNAAYDPAIDDGQFARNELKPDTTGWRAEKYAARTEVLVLDHFEDDTSSVKYHDDGSIASLLVRRELSCSDFQTTLTDSVSGSREPTASVQICRP